MRRTLPTALALLLATAACDGDSFDPGDATRPALATANGRANGMVTVPMDVQATLFWVVVLWEGMP